MLDIWTAFDGTDSTIQAVIYIVLSIFTDLKLKRIIGLPTLFADLNLEISYHLTLVLKYGTDVVPNLQTVVWLGLPESFVHNLALSFAQKHLCR